MSEKMEAGKVYVYYDEFDNRIFMRSIYPDHSSIVWAIEEHTYTIGLVAIPSIEHEDLVYLGEL
jgi:hypothetical protein